MSDDGNVDTGGGGGGGDKAEESNNTGDEEGGGGGDMGDDGNADEDEDGSYLQSCDTGSSRNDLMQPKACWYPSHPANKQTTN